MKTYQFEIMGKLFSLTMAEAKAKKLRASLWSIRQIHHYILVKRDGYTMQEWTPTPQYKMTDKQCDGVFDFFETVQKELKTKDYERVLKQCQDTFDELALYDTQVKEVNEVQS